jgi:PDZ domain-containing secreted protein
LQASQGGFGIAISGAPSSSLSASSKASDQGGCGTGGGILISDVIPNGPAFGLLQVGDRITSCNGYPLEHAEYGSAVAVMKESQQLNMVSRNENREREKSIAINKISQNNYCLTIIIKILPTSTCRLSNAVCPSLLWSSSSAL